MTSNQLFFNNPYGSKNVSNKATLASEIKHVIERRSQSRLEAKKEQDRVNKTGMG